MPEEGMSVMDPAPGQVWVEYMKDHEDGVSKKKEVVDSGLDVEHKKKHGKRVYLSRVEPPANPEKLHVGDRIVALNGKSIENYGSLDEVREVLNYQNVITLVIDPTLQR